MDTKVVDFIHTHRDQFVEHLVASIGAAIHHHPHRCPAFPRPTHGFIDLRAGIETGNEDQVRGGGGSHDGKPGGGSRLRSGCAGREFTG